ncbi:MAG: hypothetical protein JO217_00935 [Acidobacteriaceae bacterium]|nr:hypothetical protein [Acidobacteriaceae bacterium]
MRTTRACARTTFAIRVCIRPEKWLGRPLQPSRDKEAAAWRLGACDLWDLNAGLLAAALIAAMCRGILHRSDAVQLQIMGIRY